MARNILLSEWCAQLAEWQKAHPHVCLGNHRGNPEALSWENKTLSVTLELSGDCPGERYLVPRSSVGAWHTPRSQWQAADVLVDLLCAIDLLKEVAQLQNSLAGVRVWLGQAPCDYCSIQTRSKCTYCEGTGWRMEKEVPSGDRSES